MLFYSVLNALTGSFLEANLAGIKPEINVKIVLIEINVIAFCKVNIAIDVVIAPPATLLISELIGKVNIKLIKTPIVPETKPIINVSLLNTLVISFF